MNECIKLVIESRANEETWTMKYAFRIYCYRWKSFPLLYTFHELGQRIIHLS